MFKCIVLCTTVKLALNDLSIVTSISSNNFKIYHNMALSALLDSFEKKTCHYYKYKLESHVITVNLIPNTTEKHY